MSDKHSRSIRLIEMGVAIAGCEKDDMLKKTVKRWVIFTFYVTRIFIAVEEKLLGFVLVSKRAPSCTEAAVL